MKRMPELGFGFVQDINVCFSKHFNTADMTQLH